MKVNLISLEKLDLTKKNLFYEQTLIFLDCEYYVISQENNL